MAGLAALAALAAAPALAAPAAAQAQTPDAETRLSASASISPNKVGTRARPRGVRLNVRAQITTPGDGEKPVMTGGRIFFPQGSLYRGGRFTKCSYATLARRGLSGCPRRSIMGTGSARALADNVPTTPRLTVVNLGQRNVCIWTVLTNPARVSACVTGTIRPQRGQWRYRLDYQVPRNLQVVAGVPIAVQSLNLTAGRRAYARTWLATTGCPRNGRFRYRVQVNLDTGASPLFNGTTRCRR